MSNYTNIQKQEAKQEEENLKHLPFNIQWLDSSYQQTCLPDSPWQKILDDLEPSLADKVRQQFSNPERRQILIELLGKLFQWKLFRTEPDTPTIILPPTMPEEHRRKLENEAKSWLQIQTHKSALEIGAAVTEDEDINHLSNDMKNFLEYTYQIVRKSLERYLYQVQQKEQLKHEEQKSQEISKKKAQDQLTGGTKLRSILRDAKLNSKQLPIIDEFQSTPYPLSSQYSDIVSSSVVAILKRDPRRIIFIREKLFGQQLPISLRQFIWTECLLRFEKKPFDYDLSFVELQTRREFAAGVTRGKTELKLINPSHSPVSNLIENAVIETYSKVHALHPYLEEHHLRFTIKILNVLYTYKKDYEPYFIYWLLPFQLSYRDEKNKDEEIYVIAMHLDLFVRHCFPKWGNVFTIASKIMTDLSTNDAEFYDHLKTISKIRTKVNPKDFVTEIISLESKQSGSATQYAKELMSDPVIFLRKWIGEMFFGILNTNSALYLWDQFFMIKWNTTYIEHATKAILYLLRDRFMYATDYDQLRKVFLDEPCLLHTADVQAAFVHLALKNADPKYIPAMNQRFYPSKPIIPRIDDNRQIPNKKKAYLETVGIKDISLTLAIPANLAITGGTRPEFDIKSIIVEIQIYGAGEKLGDVSTGSLPVLRGKDSTISNWQRITVDIPNDKLVLSIKEARPSHMPTRIQALVIVRQRVNILNLVTIGHCRFPLYIPQKIGNLDTWDVTFGPVTRALHAGMPPVSIDMIPEVPKAFVSDKIGPGSSISLVVFDPKAEQHFSQVNRSAETPAKFFQ
ncbi:unnamed protein product [Rotaria magnacalcarata]|uniref:Uncharacterized protein n=11 Tax=Rotaria magnacalcarata TaxID=392030 RepID=A0A816T4M9_9BILA|nr:unnamed protein product [Rotaria magnacalcarata]CAF3953813.1 unnamed protein product [Rotaria magnacalcarata]CAF4041946.1 unnamed protein product [Rotaria magnacalcarata]